MGGRARRGQECLAARPHCPPPGCLIARDVILDLRVGRRLDQVPDHLLRVDQLPDEIIDLKHELPNANKTLAVSTLGGSASSHRRYRCCNLRIVPETQRLMTKTPVALVSLRAAECARLSRFAQAATRGTY